MAMAAPHLMYPAIVDWTSGARAKLLASLSQVSQLAIRHCRRHASKAAFRGGKGKLAATKELNTSGAAGSAANQQWRGHRAVAGLAAEPATPFWGFRLLAPLGPPFAALPFLSSQALLAVDQELSLPAEGSLPAPVAAQEAPSFAAAPAYQAQLHAHAVADGSHTAAPARTAAELVRTPRDPRKAHSPLARYALLPASRSASSTAVKAGGVSKQRQRQQSARQLMTALLDWAHLCAGENTASDVATVGRHGSRDAVSKRAAAGTDMRGSLLQYARLSC